MRNGFTGCETDLLVEKRICWLKKWIYWLKNGFTG
jgi:hypothetical protein